MEEYCKSVRVWYESSTGGFAASRLNKSDAERVEQGEPAWSEKHNIGGRRFTTSAQSPEYQRGRKIPTFRLSEHKTMLVWVLSSVRKVKQSLTCDGKCFQNSDKTEPSLLLLIILRSKKHKKKSAVYWFLSRFTDTFIKRFIYLRMAKPSNTQVLTRCASRTLPTSGRTIPTPRSDIPNIAVGDIQPKVGQTQHLVEETQLSRKFTSPGRKIPRCRSRSRIHNFRSKKPNITFN